MTYEELLSDDRWGSKRNQIIIRDRLQCTLCANERLLTNSFTGALVLKGKNDQGALYGFMGSVTTGITSSKKIFLKNDTSITDVVISQGDIVYIDSEFVNEPFLKILGIRSWLQQDRQAVTKRWENLPFANNYNEFEWKYVPGLHVHHKYYQIGLKPWGYPDEALQTLCWVCHEELHKTCKVDLLDERGKVIKYLTPCHRCYGAGVFPEYRHIIKGLCFHCRGAKYEEMIV